jgi:hypothetical protein
MQHSQQLERIRQLVSEIFRAHGVEEEDATVEKILIRDGFYCGRCFVCDGFRAVWFIEEKSVKFYRPGGDFLCSLLVEMQPDQRERRVA